MFQRALVAVAFLSISGCRLLNPGADLPPTRPSSNTNLPATTPESVSPPTGQVQAPTPAPAPAPAPTPIDPSGVVRTSATVVSPPSQATSVSPAPEGTAKGSKDADPRMRMGGSPIMGKFTGAAVARVGTDEITLAEVLYATQEILREQGFDQRLSREDQERQIVQIRTQLIKSMIDQLLVVQEAKKLIKDKKKWDQFNHAVDKEFNDAKLPNLLKKHEAADENELRIKLEAKGQSLDEIRKKFRNDTITQHFIFTKVVDRIKPGLPELETYYHAHLHEFDSPAQVTFHEIVLRFDNDSQKVEARRKAEILLNRLRKGEDFAKLAKAESQGSTAEKGGLWNKIQPGSFAPEVNDAIDRMPIRQLSPIIEGKSSLRIIRVEARRKAGPLSFEESQQRVGDELRKQLITVAVESYLDKLRSKTVIYNLYEENRVDPKVRRAGASSEEIGR